jgi:hypothetical protein
MNSEKQVLQIEFKNSKEKEMVLLADLENRTIHFG